MVKRLTAVFVLSLFLVFVFAGGAFAAAKKSSDVKWTRHISQDWNVDGSGFESFNVPQKVYSKYMTGGSKLTCTDIQPEVGVVIQHDEVGDTWYDFQKNGSMGRMISVTSGGYRHISWMWTEAEYPGTPRFVDANCKDPAGTYIGQVHVDGLQGVDNCNAGYSNQTHLHDGTSLVINHRTAASPTWWTCFTIDDDVCGGFFTKHWDLPDYIEANTSGEQGSWPKADVLYCTDESVSPDPMDYIHVVLTEGNTNPVPVMIGYERCYFSPTSADSIVCETHLSSGKATYQINIDTYASGAAFYPIGRIDSSVSVTPVVTVSPVSKKVGIGYLTPACDGSGDYLEDCCYHESINNGNEWLTGGFPARNNITNFGCTGTERCFHDLAVTYDYQDSLHIVYLTCGFDPESPGYYQPGVSRLYHWSRKDGISQIHGKLQGGNDPGAHNCILAKMSISAKDPVYHPGGDSVYLFCIWTEFDSADVSGSDYSNGDIMGSGSFDGGASWGGIFNLTNTQTNGCTPGNCVSEHWSTLAQNMYDGDLHIEYVCDRDAGGAIQDGTQWMSNPMMYLHLTEWEVTAEARGDYIVISPEHWYHPPLKIVPGGSRTLQFDVRSIGNANLIWNASSAHSCIEGSAGGTLAPGESQTVTFTVNGSGACEGTFIDGSILLTTNEEAKTETYIPVQAIVTEDYYECPTAPETVDTLYNGILVLSTDANCGEAISDSATISDTALDVFYLGGTIIATTSGTDTLVGRYMREDRHTGAQDMLYTVQCEPGWEPHFWIVYTKDIFMHDFEPPADYKWYWWEASKQIKFFKESAPEEYKRLVIKYIEVRRHDPPEWWPDQSAFVDYDDTYIGVAEDIDCPWDSSQGEPNVTTEENATNLGGYDATNHIAWMQGFGSGEHPQYDNYYCGIALANDNGSAREPIGSYCVKNNYYLYPNGGWGWKEQELYDLAASTGNTIQDPDSLVDRAYVVTADTMHAGSYENEKKSFVVILAAAPNGLTQLQALVDTGRAIVAREYAKGYPVLCGDANLDHAVSAGDIVYLLTYLYRGGPPPACPLIGRADCNLDGGVSAGDVVFLLSYLYRGGPAPVCPGVWGP